MSNEAPLTIKPIGPKEYRIRTHFGWGIEQVFWTRAAAEAFIKTWKATNTDADYMARVRPEVEEMDMRECVWRLNTLLKDSEDKVAELEHRLNCLRRARIGWTCMGNTRAIWQTSADAEWIRQNRPDWKVEVNDDGDGLTVTL